MLWLPCRNDRSQRKAYKPAGPNEGINAFSAVGAYAQFASLPSASAYATASRIVCQHACGISLPFRFSGLGSEGEIIDLAEWHIRLGLNEAANECHELVVRKHVGDGPSFEDVNGFQSLVQQNGLAGNPAFGWGASANNWVEIKLLEDGEEIASTKITAVNQAFPGFGNYLQSNFLRSNRRLRFAGDSGVFLSPVGVHHVFDHLSGHFHRHSMWADDYTEAYSWDSSAGVPPTNWAQPYGRLAVGYMIDDEGVFRLYAHVGDGAIVFGAGSASLCVPINRRPTSFRADVFCRDLDGNDVDDDIFIRSGQFRQAVPDDNTYYFAIFGPYVQQEVLARSLPLKPEQQELLLARKPQIGWSNHRAVNQLARRQYDSPEIKETRKPGYQGQLPSRLDRSGRFLDDGSTAEWQMQDPEIPGPMKPSTKPVGLLVPPAFAPGHPDGRVAFVPVPGAKSNVHWDDEVNELLSQIRVKFNRVSNEELGQGPYTSTLESEWMTLDHCGGWNEYNGTGAIKLWRRPGPGAPNGSSLTSSEASMYVAIWRQDLMDLPEQKDDEPSPRVALVIKAAVYAKFPAEAWSGSGARDESFSWAIVLEGEELESFFSGEEVVPGTRAASDGPNNSFAYDVRPVIQAIG